jgi:hypothetical protein
MKKGQNGRKSLRRLKPAVCFNAHKTRRRRRKRRRRKSISKVRSHKIKH